MADCPRCGDRWSDHAGVEEPICRNTDSPQDITYQEAILDGADPTEGFYDDDDE